MTQRVLGALYGHAFGDAAGSRLELCGIPNKREIEHAMNLEGGGVFGLNPGQITDDGELTLQVFRALYDFHVEKICDGTIDDLFFNRFLDWFESTPFDIGYTTRNAFYLDNDCKNKQSMLENVQHFNGMSESNGALMRCIPHAIFAYFFSWTEDELYSSIQMDVSLTHAKKCVIDVCFAYCIIVLYLLLEKSVDDIFTRLDKIDSVKIKEMIANSNTIPTVTRNIGWDKHAFILVLYFLKNSTDFESSIKTTIALGGDTDTNAAIVGGVLGAMFGMNAIPHIDKIMNCKPAHGRWNFHPKEYLYKIEKMNLMNLCRVNSK